MEKAKKEVKKLLTKYKKDWNKYGMGSGSSNSIIVSDLEKLVKLFDIPNVSGSLPSDKLCKERGLSFESKTYYDLKDGEYIGDFEIGAKWAVDYFLGNDR